MAEQLALSLFDLNPAGFIVKLKADARAKLFDGITYSDLAVSEHSFWFYKTGKTGFFLSILLKLIDLHSTRKGADIEKVKMYIEGESIEELHTADYNAKRYQGGQRKLVNPVFPIILDENGARALFRIVVYSVQNKVSTFYSASPGLRSERSALLVDSFIKDVNLCFGKIVPSLFAKQTNKSLILIPDIVTSLAFTWIGKYEKPLLSAGIVEKKIFNESFRKFQIFGQIMGKYGQQLQELIVEEGGAGNLRRTFSVSKCPVCGTIVTVNSIKLVGFKGVCRSCGVNVVAEYDF